jgi:hypothetical protein
VAVLELLIRLVLFFPAWPVVMAWLGVVLAFAAVAWCTAVRRPVAVRPIITISGALPVVVTALWLAAIYTWIAAVPELPVAVRISPVRIALFAIGLALVNFAWPCVEALFLYLRDYVRAVFRRRNYREQ